MGFDINVMMEMFMCPATGKPFYYGYDEVTKNLEKVYDLPDISVPAKMCEYLVGRGSIFYAYTEFFNEREVFNVTVDEFLEAYPSWRQVKESNYYSEETTDYWCEEDHEGFKRLLEWCTQQRVMFRVCWSY